MAVPQAQFAGSAPADVVNQAGQLGARWGEILQNGVRMGIDAYQKKKDRESALELQKSSEMSASDRLAFQLEYQELTQLIQEEGPGAFVKQGDRIRKLFDKVYKGAGDDIYEATSKAYLDTMGLEDASKLGLFSFGEDAAKAGMPPVAADGAQAQAPAPAIEPQDPAAVAPQAQAPAAAQPQAPAAMDFRTFLKSKKPGDAAWAAGIDRATDETLMRGNPNSYEAWKKSGTAAAPSATGQASTSATASVSSSRADPQAYKEALGVVNANSPLSTKASSAIDKILADNADPASKLPAAEAAAARTAASRYASVADNPAVAAYFKAGGSAAAITALRDKYNELVDTDPQLAEFIRREGSLSSPEAKLYLQSQTTAIAAQKAADKAAIDAGTLSVKEQTLALKAAESKANIATAWANSQARILTATRLNDKASVGLLEKQNDDIRASYKIYYTAEKDARDRYKQMMLDQNKKWTIDQENKYIIDLYNTPGTILTTARDVAASLMAKTLGLEVDSVKQQIQTDPDYFIDLLGVKALELTPGKTTDVAPIPLTEKSKAAAPAQAPAAPPASNYGVKPGVFD